MWITEPRSDSSDRKREYIYLKKQQQNKNESKKEERKKGRVLSRIRTPHLHFTTTVEPRFNEPLYTVYNEVLGITKDFLSSARPK